MKSHSQVSSAETKMQLCSSSFFSQSAVDEYYRRKPAYVELIFSKTILKNREHREQQVFLAISGPSNIRCKTNQYQRYYNLITSWKKKCRWTRDFKKNTSERKDFHEQKTHHYLHSPTLGRPGFPSN